MGSGTFAVVFGVHLAVYRWGDGRAGKTSSGTHFLLTDAPLFSISSLSYERAAIDSWLSTKSVSPMNPDQPLTMAGRSF